MQFYAGFLSLIKLSILSVVLLLPQLLPALPQSVYADGGFFIITPRSNSVSTAAVSNSTPQLPERRLAAAIGYGYARQFSKHLFWDVSGRFWVLPPDNGVSYLGMQFLDLCGGIGAGTSLLHFPLSLYAELRLAPFQLISLAATPGYAMPSWLTVIFGTEWIFDRQYGLKVTAEYGLGALFARAGSSHTYESIGINASLMVIR
jgi:hypothetical protein